MEKLSITDAEQEISLTNSKIDSLTESVKVGIKAIGSVADNFLGITPVGSIITELITTTIPSRRIENFVLMIEILNDKVKYIEKDVLEQKMKSEEFQDLIQDGIIQASRALTKERLEYIASILKNSLTQQELEHIEEKRLLWLLSELNDVEIIWLKRYSFSTQNFQDSEFQAFYKKHENIFSPAGTTRASSEEDFDKVALQKSYTNNLLRLGLIDSRNVPAESHNIVYNCNRLGKMLLRYIDFDKAEDTE